MKRNAMWSKGNGDCDFVTLNPRSRFEFFSYSETCLFRTSLGPTFEFRIDKCLVYAG